MNPEELNSDQKISDPVIIQTWVSGVRGECTVENGGGNKISIGNIRIYYSAMMIVRYYVPMNNIFSGIDIVLGIYKNDIN